MCLDSCALNLMLWAAILQALFQWSEICQIDSGIFYVLGFSATI